MEVREVKVIMSISSRKPPNHHQGMYVQEIIAMNMVDVTIQSHSLLIRNTFICKKKTNYPRGITADGWLVEAYRW